MTLTSHLIHVRTQGEFALFTRPELKVERFSYEVITPSAARGILEAVLWKPQMRWLVERIVVLKPIRFLNFKRNEVMHRVPSAAVSWAKNNQGASGFFADDARAQRNAVILREVDYVVTARIQVVDPAGTMDDVAKYAEMFRRRVRNGQHFQQPYFGCREFPANVSLATGEELAEPETRRELSRDLGMMLHDIDFRDSGHRRPVFFQAVMQDGVIAVPRLATTLEEVV